MRFAAILALGAVAYNLVFYFWIAGSSVYQAILSGYAGVAAVVLRGFGYNTWAVADVVNGSDFTLRVATGCDATQPMALFAIAVLATPVAWRDKSFGLFVGVACLILLNLVRVVTLYVAGAEYPVAFDFLHVGVWQAAFVLSAIFQWLLWAVWAMRRRGAENVRSPS